MVDKLNIKDRINEYIQDCKEKREDSGPLTKIVIALLVVYLLIAIVVGVYWSSEPGYFPVHERAAARAEVMQVEPVIGFTSTSTLIEITETLLNKPGGYIHNDKLPPGLWLDNMPRSEEHTSELQSRPHLVCRLLLEKKKKKKKTKIKS